MMSRYDHHALSLLIGLVTLGCGDHDRVVGTRRNDDGGTSGNGGNGGEDTTPRSENGGATTRTELGGAASTMGGSNAQTSTSGGDTMGGASNGSGGESASAGGASVGGSSNASGGVGGTAPMGGAGGTSSAETIPIDPCAVLACGKNGQCVVSASNTATCACKDGYVQKEGRCMSTSPITDVFAGDSFACALRSDGTVGCWGQNLDYALGDGVLESNDSSNTPLEVPNIEHAIALGGSQHAACVVDADQLRQVLGIRRGQNLEDTDRRRAASRGEGRLRERWDRVRRHRRRTCVLLGTDGELLRVFVLSRLGESRT
ncbi:MAG: hypothetical protein QM784_22925 [Polyangiaceae bacterium]